CAGGLGFWVKWGTRSARRGNRSAAKMEGHEIQNSSLKNLPPDKDMEIARHAGRKVSTPPFATRL
ncbi:MAG: hypothetical protein NWS48_14265, partial [Akkermansiaceae bacterium]|nr:hypothetical protein [Akkermansiaceae bacterium]